MGIRKIATGGWPILVLVSYNWRPRIGEEVDIEELKSIIGEVTTTFDPVPDHYARGVSNYAWPIKTLVRELTSSERLRKIWGRLIAKPYYYCSIVKGILVTDRNLKPIACLVPAGYSDERYLVKRMAIVIPMVTGEYIVFTAYRDVAPVLAKLGCENIAYGVFICRRDPEDALRREGVHVFRSREVVTERYLKEVVGLEA